MADILACDNVTPHGFHGWGEGPPYHVCNGIPDPADAEAHETLWAIVEGGPAPVAGAFPWAVENRVVREPVWALFRDREDALRFNEEMFDGRVIPNPGPDLEAIARELESHTDLILYENFQDTGGLRCACGRWSAPAGPLVPRGVARIRPRHEFTLHVAAELARALS